ncbi:MAG: hypothetical protein IJ724_09055 [Muribaculaceae bacterium]|nr:hypothetical protein [Muribaculaceae bacterium]
MNTPAMIKTALIFFLVGIVCGGILGFWYGRATATHPDDGHIVSTDTVTRYDTLMVKSPIARDSIVVKYITKTLPSSKQKKNDTFLAENYAQNNGENIPPQGLSDERDSVAVKIPITQKRYDGENYSAWVSGYEPRLDSISVRERTHVVTIKASKPPNRWHIGVQCGAGFALKSRQIEPFIGVGLSYSIISF